MATMRRINSCLVVLPCLLLSWFFCVGICHAADTLRAGEVMRDGDFLESSGQRFRLQFFSPGSSKNRYVGIKYMDYNGFTVWPANPENPLNDSSGILNLTQDGKLVITDDWGTSVTINSEQPAKSTNTSLTLLDSGNLVLRDGEQIVWQSFDHPSDTLLPGVKLGWFDLKTGRPRGRFLTSWTSPEVLAPGAFKLGVDPNNTKQLVVWRRGVPYWRSGTWNGYKFSYLPDTQLSEAFSHWNFSYSSNENERYFTFTVSNNIFGWIEMQAFGHINQFVYTERAQTVYKQSSCDDDKMETRSKGCVSPEPSRCRGGDVFTQKTGFMNGSEYLYNFSLGLSDCREICTRNCSCDAYATALSDGTACRFSRGQTFYYGGEEVFYVRNKTVAAKADTLRAGEVMRDGEFLESSGRRFQLQFFSPGSSKNRYLGIKFMDYNGFTVWAANLENPLNDSSGILNLTQDGNLVITDDWGTSVTMNSEQPAKSTNTSLTLLDSGNLILRDREQIVWQSFDYPSSTLLPGMKLGWFDLKTGRLRSRFLNSWTSPEVLALGTFKLGVDPNNTKQLVVWRRGVPYWHSGNWNGYNFTYLPNTELRGAFSQWNFSYFSNENESYFILTMSNNIFGWIEMQAFGQINQFIYTERAETVYTQSSCDNELETWSKGCVMPEPSRCRGGDVFTKKMGFLNGSEYLYNFSLGLSDCREICRRNCSCNAYASAQSDGTACKFSLGQMFYSGGEEFFYVRNDTVADKDRSRKRQLWLTVGAPVASLLIIVLVSIFCYLQGSHFCFGGKNASSQYVIRQEMSHRAGTSIAGIDEFSGSPKLDLSGKKGHELPFFNFSSIEIATDYFSNANKLGQGGFGPVYKGMLVKGQEIAVKRLSKSSKQGVEEFKNEVLLISKLQHRNLVRLLGCCIEGEERILIYEYLPNNSLDSFLFDAAKRGFLDWKRRVCIIEGIAQGLLYLHKYSRLRIIHRDLKTSNILLDHDMNPKISDFGIARIFEGNESQANTNRIVGTYGYMSPEYAMDGLFSEKSDVFSFGVMMLEIISGKKNTGFYESDRTLNLLGYVWDLYRDGRCLEVIDLAVEETCSRNEVMRCLQVGLLCVQESAVDRPTMSNVVSMLSNESMTLPAPKQPGFSNIVSGKDATLPEYEIPCSINDATISEIVAR